MASRITATSRSGAKVSSHQDRSSQPIARRPTVSSSSNRPFDLPDDLDIDVNDDVGATVSEWDRIRARQQSAAPAAVDSVEPSASGEDVTSFLQRIRAQNDRSTATISQKLSELGMPAAAAAASAMSSQRPSAIAPPPPMSATAASALVTRLPHQSSTNVPSRGAMGATRMLPPSTAYLPTFSAAQIGSRYEETAPSALPVAPDANSGDASSILSSVFARLGLDSHETKSLVSDVFGTSSPKSSPLLDLTAPSSKPTQRKTGGGVDLNSFWARVDQNHEQAVRASLNSVDVNADDAVSEASSAPSAMTAQPSVENSESAGEARKIMKAMLATEREAEQLRAHARLQARNQMAASAAASSKSNQKSAAAGHSTKGPFGGRGHFASSAGSSSGDAIDPRLTMEARHAAVARQRQARMEAQKLAEAEAASRKAAAGTTKSAAPVVSAASETNMSDAEWAAVEAAEARRVAEQIRKMRIRPASATATTTADDTKLQLNVLKAEEHADRLEIASYGDKVTADKAAEQARLNAEAAAKAEADRLFAETQAATLAAAQATAQAEHEQRVRRQVEEVEQAKRLDELRRQTAADMAAQRAEADRKARLEATRAELCHDLEECERVEALQRRRTLVKVFGVLAAAARATSVKQTRADAHFRAHTRLSHFLAWRSYVRRAADERSDAQELQRAQEEAASLLMARRHFERHLLIKCVRSWANEARAGAEERKHRQEHALRRQGMERLLKTLSTSASTPSAQAIPLALEPIPSTPLSVSDAAVASASALVPKPPTSARAHAAPASSIVKPPRLVIESSTPHSTLASARSTFSGLSSARNTSLLTDRSHVPSVVYPTEAAAARAQVAAERRERLKARYADAEQRRLAEARAVEEARLAQEAADKALAAETARQAKADALLKAERAAAARALEISKGELADMHAERALLLYHGWRPWRRLVEMSRAKARATKVFAAHKLCARVFRAWRGVVDHHQRADVAAAEGRERGAERMAKYHLQRNHLRAWREFVVAQRSDERRWAPWQHFSHLLRVSFTHWHRATQIARGVRRVQEAAREKIATIHAKKFTMVHFFRRWREGAHEMADERALEKQKSQLLNKARGWLDAFRLQRAADESKRVQAAAAAEERAAQNDPRTIVDQLLVDIGVTDRLSNTPKASQQVVQSPVRKSAPRVSASQPLVNWLRASMEAEVASSLSSFKQPALDDFEQHAHFDDTDRPLFATVTRPSGFTAYVPPKAMSPHPIDQSRHFPPSPLTRRAPETSAGHSLAASLRAPLSASLSLAGPLGAGALRGSLNQSLLSHLTVPPKSK